MGTITNRLMGLAHSAAIIFIGTVIGNILALGSQIWIASELGPELFGDIALAYSVISVGGILAVAGIADGVTKLQSDAGSNVNSGNDVLSAGYYVVLSLGVLSLVTILLTRGYISSLMDEPSIERFLLFLSPYLILLPLARVSLGSLRAGEQSFAATMARDFAPRVSAIILFLALVLLGHPLWGAIGYWLAVPSVFLVTALYFLRQSGSFDWSTLQIPQWKTVRNLWSFSWPLAISSAMFVVLSNLDVLMIGYFLDSSQTGYYRAIQPLRRVPTFAFTAVAFLLFPIISQYHTDGEIEAIDRIYKQSTKWIVLGTFPVVISVVVFAPSVVTVLFGDEYRPASLPLSVLLGGSFIRAIFGLNGDILKAIGSTRTELYAAILGVLTNAGLNLLLIPRNGIVGAAIATVSGYATYNLVESLMIYRSTNAHPFLPTTFIPLLPTTMVVIIIYLVGGSTGWSILGLISIGCIVLLVQLTSILVTNSISEADQELVAKISDQIGIDSSIITNEK